MRRSFSQQRRVGVSERVVARRAGNRPQRGCGLLRLVRSGFELSWQQEQQVLERMFHDLPAEMLAFSIDLVSAFRFFVQGQ